LTANAIAQCPETNSNCHGADHWVFGDSVYIHFSDTGLVTSKRSFSSYEASSSLVSHNGGLVAYGNSELFYNKDSVFYYNPFGNQSSTQGMYFIRSNVDTIAAFITEEAIRSDYSNRLVFGRINLKSFEIIDTQVLVAPSTEKIAIVDHQNRRYKWIAVHEANSDRIFCFLYTGDKLIECPVINYGELDYSKGDYFNGAGQSKFSPNGEFLAMANATSSTELWRFDSEGGTLSEHQLVTGWYGVEFSKNSRNLFASGTIINAFPLDSFGVKPLEWLSEEITPSFNVKRGAMQLGPNGRIYMAYKEEGALGVIDNPDATDLTNIKYQSKGQKLHSGTQCQLGLPSFNASTFYTPALDFAYTEGCWSNNYQFTALDTFGANKYDWQITDQSGASQIRRSGKSINYVFPNTDSVGMPYEIRLVASNGLRSDTVFKTVTIRPNLTNGFLGRDTFFCSGNPLILRAPMNQHCIHWNGEEPNMDIRKGAIQDYKYFQKDSLLVDAAGEYTIRITNKTFCQAWDTILVEEKAVPSKPNITYNVELASDITAHKYIWFINDTFLIETQSKSLKPLKNGRYRVKLVSEFGCESDLSDEILVDNISVFDIDRRIFKMYPNPTEGVLTVELNQPDLYEINIQTLDGKQIVRKTINWELSATFNLMLPGLYIITVSDSHGNLDRRSLVVLN
jgi:hypothetical protein